MQKGCVFRIIIRDALRRIILIYISLIVISLIISCEKEIIDIDSQLPLVGIWDWLYSQDPKTSEIFTPETENYTHYLIFSGDSVAQIFYDDSLSQQCKYSISVTNLVDGTIASSLKLCSESPSPLVYNDTLRLSYASTGGYIDYYLKRIKL